MFTMKKLILPLVLIAIIFMNISVIGASASPSVPSVSLSPTTGSKGSMVKVTVNGFGPDFSLYLNESKLVTQDMPSSSGGFVKSFLIPDIPAGLYD